MRKHITITAHDRNGKSAVLHFRTLNEWEPLDVGYPTEGFLPNRITNIEFITTKGDEDTTVSMLSIPL